MPSQNRRRQVQNPSMGEKSSAFHVPHSPGGQELSVALNPCCAFKRFLLYRTQARSQFTIHSMTLHTQLVRMAEL